MKIRHGVLMAVLGHAAKSNGMTIVPIAVELDGNGFSPEFPISQLPPQKIPPILRVPIQREFDVSWVAARIPKVFGFTPEQSENEKMFLEVGFVAFPEGELEGVPFYCSDHYGRTALFFSPNETDTDLKNHAATAFWEALLAEPESLAGFEGKVLHLGALVWLHFGCKEGEPFFFETHDSDEDE